MMMREHLQTIRDCRVAICEIQKRIRDRICDAAQRNVESSADVDNADLVYHEAKIKLACAEIALLGCHEPNSNEG